MRVGSETCYFIPIKLGLIGALFACFDINVGASFAQFAQTRYIVDLILFSITEFLSFVLFRLGLTEIL